MKRIFSMLIVLLATTAITFAATDLGGEVFTIKKMMKADFLSLLIDSILFAVYGILVGFLIWG